MMKNHVKKYHHNKLIVEKDVCIHFPLHAHETTYLGDPGTSEAEDRYRWFCRETIYGGQRVSYNEYEEPLQTCQNTENTENTENCERIGGDILSLSELMNISIRGNPTDGHWCSVSTRAKTSVLLTLAPSVDEIIVSPELMRNIDLASDAQSRDLLSTDDVLDQVLENLLNYLSRPPLMIKTEVFGVITSKKAVEDEPSKNFLLGRGGPWLLSPSTACSPHISLSDANDSNNDSRLIPSYAVILYCEGRRKMLTEDEFTLYWATKHNRLALVTGTGVSMALTQNRLSLWDDFISYLRERIWPTSQEQSLSHSDNRYASSSTSLDLQLFHSLCGDPHAQSEYLYLCAERDGCLHALVSEILQVVGQLIPLSEPRSTWSGALAGFTGPILTFNYDIALEITVGRLPVTACAAYGVSPHPSNSQQPRDPRGSNSNTTTTQSQRSRESDVTIASQMIHPFSQTVIHLHGIYTHDQSVVLRLQSYLEAVKAVSETFVSLAEQGFVFLCVGMKGVLSDPDLFPYWRWEDVRQRIQDRRTRPSKRTHFVIFRKDEKVAFPRRLISTRSVGSNRQDEEFPFFKKITAESYEEIPLIVKDIVQGTFQEKLSSVTTPRSNDRLHSFSM
jgi:hypothetical protein